MLGARMIAERPVPLDAAVTTRRIYAPVAYRFVRDTPMVPVAHFEAERLASWFPLVWQVGRHGPTLIALRALIADQTAQPPRARGLLPLLLTAYPFVLDPLVDPAEARVLFDDGFADEPTDAGATVMTQELKPGLATRQRIDTLRNFALAWPRTKAIGEALKDARLLEPWDLSFEIAGRRIAVPDLWIARRASFETGGFAPILAEHGVEAARLLGLHRLSLFRAGILLTMARHALQADGDRKERAS
jgi:hypothetical protein